MTFTTDLGDVVSQLAGIDDLHLALARYAHTHLEAVISPGVSVISDVCYYVRSVMEDFYTLLF